MFQVLSADQLPASIANQSASRLSGAQVPFDAIPPGGGVRIPFGTLLDSPRDFRRFHDSLRAKTCRASTRLGIRFSVRKLDDSFFVTRPAA